MKFKDIVSVFGTVAVVPLISGAALAQTAAAPAAPAAAASSAAVQVAAGAAVYGPQGNEVGKVEKVENGTAVINTGKHSAAVPVSAFGRNEKGLLVSMTRDQLDAAVEAATAKAQGNLAASLVVGAAVRSADGVAMGKIAAVSPEGLVTVQRDSDSFALKQDSFTADASGVTLRLTAAQLNAAIAQQQAAAAPAASAPAQP